MFLLDTNVLSETLRPQPHSGVMHEIEHVFFKTLDVLPYDRHAAQWHARQSARLKDEGRTPPFVDGQTAAIAAVNGLTLVTHDVTDFAALEGLTVEDWLAR